MHIKMYIYVADVLTKRVLLVSNNSKCYLVPATISFLFMSLQTRIAYTFSLIFYQAYCISYMIFSTCYNCFKSNHYNKIYENNSKCLMYREIEHDETYHNTKNIINILICYCYKNKKELN